MPRAIGDGITSETMLDSLTLEILEGGDFREVRVERSAIVTTREALERVTGQRWYGPDQVREEQPPARQETIGRWELRNDSILFYASPEQVRQELMTTLQSAYPQAPQPVLLQFVDSIVAELTTRPRYAGQVTNSRMELLDVDGRLLVFQRIDDALKVQSGG